MDVSFATKSEIKNWNKRLRKNPDGGNYCQMYEVAVTKRLGGWRPRFIVAGDFSLVVLEKTVPLLGRYWYVPKGPGVTEPSQLAKLVPVLEQFAREHRVFAVRIEPEIIAGDKSDRRILAIPGVAASRAIQPNVSTIFVDIDRSPDELIMSFNQKARNAIRRAERDGVVAEAVEANDENCRQMFELMEETAAGRFRARTFEYYSQFWQSLARNGHGQMFFSRFEGRVVASAFVILLGDKATYKDGGSVRQRTAYGASHILQWQAMNWAREQGAKIYDLCGVPPSDKLGDRTHPYYGIGLFKSSFQKTVTDFVGAYDIVINKTSHSLWVRYGERIMIRASQKFKNSSWY